MTTPSSIPRLRPFQPMPFGRFTLLAALASGGMGEIFLARTEASQGFEKLCVIKKILPHLAADREFINRFVHEAKMLVQLSHGAIAHVLDMGIEKGEPYLALEFVDGKDLRKVITRMREQGGTVPLPVALFVMARVLDALAYAHRKRNENDEEIRLVHRDISPQNVLVSYEGEVKVIDFGLAKSSLNPESTNPSLVLGKFLYMSPEQAQQAPVDKRSDLYSVGICLYELITGRNPYDGVPNQQLLSTVGNPSIPALEDVAPRCPSSLAQVIRRSLSVNPDDRFQTAEEFRGRLMQCLYELEPATGPENVSHFMRGAFGPEYQAERILLTSLREAAESVTVRSALPSSLLETGVLRVAPGDDAAATAPRQVPDRHGATLRPAERDTTTQLTVGAPDRDLHPQKPSDSDREAILSRASAAEREAAALREAATVRAPAPEREPAPRRGNPPERQDRDAATLRTAVPWAGAPERAGAKSGRPLVPDHELPVTDPPTPSTARGHAAQPFEASDESEDVPYEDDAVASRRRPRGVLTFMLLVVLGALGYVAYDALHRPEAERLPALASRSGASTVPARMPPAGPPAEPVDVTAPRLSPPAPTLASTTDEESLHLLVPLKVPAPRPKPVKALAVKPPLVRKRPAAAATAGLSPLLREWARTKAAFTKMDRDRSCASDELAPLCLRYRQLATEMDEGTSTQSDEQLLVRVRSMYRSIEAQLTP